MRAYGIETHTKLRPAILSWMAAIRGVVAAAGPSCEGLPFSDPIPSWCWPRIDARERGCLFSTLLRTLFFIIFICINMVIVAGARDRFIVIIAVVMACSCRRRRSDSVSVRGSTRGREDVYSALCFVLYWSSLIASINMVIVVVARDLVVVIVSIAMVEIWRVARMMPQGAVVSTALVTGRETELRRFQISPDHGFHRRGDSSSRKAVAVTALVTGRRT